MEIGRGLVALIFESNLTSFGKNIKNFGNGSS